MMSLQVDSWRITSHQPGGILKPVHERYHGTTFTMPIQESLPSPVLPGYRPMVLSEFIEPPKNAEKCADLLILVHESAYG
jgi:hypothetical protein